MRLFSQISLALLLAGLAAGSTWFWTISVASKPGSSNEGKRPRPPPLVETAAVRLGNVIETVEVVGTTRARNAIDVVATSAGLITRINFEAGQQLATGDVLFEIDAASEKAAVLEVESELENLRRQLKRARTLRNRKLSSNAEVDDLAAQVRATEARLAAARNRLDKRFIRAPFAGIVGLRNVSVGDYVDSNKILTTLDDLATIELDFEVPEKFFGVIRRDQRVSATSIAFPERLFRGTVRDIDTRISTATRSFRVRAELPNPDTLLPEGLFMTANLTIVERQNVLLVPQEAVIAEGDEHYVFVVRDHTAHRVGLEIGLRAEDDIEVLSGLVREDKVVTRGHQKLRNNAPVRLMQSGEKKSATESQPGPGKQSATAAPASS